MTVTFLYDKLYAQLKALEKLGVHSDKYASILYPLVESSLPVDLLIIWERHRNTISSNTSTYLLTALLYFLKLEVV